MTASAHAGRIWDEATAPEAVRLARAFEACWRGSRRGHRPTPDDFLPWDRAGGSGGTLAVLRAELTLRLGDGEPVRVESYRRRYPDLSNDVLVALAYEEFCLREEAGEAPATAEYYGRFPELAGALREIFEIHDLVRESAPTRTQPRPETPSPDLIGESRRTIGGFFLVEELGRGSFARVFLARERHLADRLVALKVSTTGSREPQALASLQHTHIVPVHSYGVDPATGLHLLCMPYFGRVTLARLLADPALREARSGAALVAALDRLAEDGAAGDRTEAVREARRTLAARTYPRAIALWGAQLADALRHAHARGVLHRDLKPSNILLAADATPMILDFNLAREVDLPGDGGAEARPGGTLAYMAPEHLDALIAGTDAGVDHRADIYALGLVVAEMLGARPLADSPPGETARQLRDRRRQGLPGALGRPGQFPPPLAAVLRRSLQPDPARRYASAGDLAVDLRAVADDLPLAFAREPWSSRSARWLRNNRGVVAGFGVAGALLLGGAVAWSRARTEVHRAEVDAERWFHEGARLDEAGEQRAAAVQFARAAERAAGVPGLETLAGRARDRERAAEAAEAAHARADRFLDQAPQLQFAILGFGGDRASGASELAAAFGPLGVLEEADFPRTPLVSALDSPRRERLIHAVDDLLYFWVVAAARAASDEADFRHHRADDAIAYCDKALAFSETPAPWTALRRWWQDRSDGVDPQVKLPSAANATSGRAAFRWYLLGTLGADRPGALAWLDAAAWLEQQDYWHRFALGFEHARGGDPPRARVHYDVATALRPGYPWAWKNRGILAADLGDWSRAMKDFDRALAACRTPSDRAGVLVERGRTHQRLGAFRAARADIAAAVALDPVGRSARRATLNRARLEADAGRSTLALTLYDSLLEADPEDRAARLGRANLLLRRGQPAAARADLDRLIDRPPPRDRAEALHRAEALCDRAAVGFAQGRLDEAHADIERSLAIWTSPAAARWLDRIRLAAGWELDAWPATPDGFDGLPRGGPGLDADLRRAAGSLRDRIRAEPDRADLRRARAIVLAAAGDDGEARAEADRVVAAAPNSAEGRLLRARVARRAGRLDDAGADVADGLRRAPDDPNLMELRGLIAVDRREWAAGAADLRAAQARGAATARGPALARALGELGRDREAADLWAELAAADPSDPRAHLGLADCYRRLRLWDRSLASLEDAAGLIEPRSPMFARLTFTSIACLPTRPDRVCRILSLARRWAAG